MSAHPEPRWDLDFSFGKQGELLVLDILKSIQNGTADVEVKTDQRASETGNLFIETHCVRNGQWKPSGLLTTQAKVWVFVLGGRAREMGNMMLALPTDWIKQSIIECRIVNETDGSHPTRGYALPLGKVFYHLTRYRAVV